MTSLTHKLFNKVDNRSINLFINLGSGQVSVALVYKNNNEKPMILNTRTSNVPFDYNPTPQELQRNVLSILDTVLADFIGELGGMYELSDLYDSHQTIHEVYVTLSPLWVSTQIVTSEQSFDTPTVITQELLQSLIDTETTPETIDASIVFARANKYQVHPEDIIGMETPEIDIQIKKSSLSREIKDAIERNITNHISTERIGGISYIPSQKVSVAAVSELFGVHDDYMIIHIDGEDSHVISKSSQEGMRFDSISYGLAEVKRQIINAGLAPNFIHARDLLHTYFNYALEDSLTQEINYVLSIESQVLANLASEMTNKTVPLFVLADENSEKFFSRYVVGDLEHVRNAVIVEHEHCEEYFDVVGEYVQPSIETLTSLLYTELISDRN